MAFDLRMASGARLSYVITELEGKVEREYTVFDKVKGLVKETRQEPAGYMIYFPRGHVIRLRTLEELKHYGIEPGKARIINMAGMHNPESPVGRLMAAQDEKTRREAYADLELSGIQLATAKTGPVLMPEQVGRSRMSRSA